MGLMPRMQSWFNIKKNLGNVVYNVDKIKKRDLIIMLIDAEKDAYDLSTFIIELCKLLIEGNFST